MTTTGHNIIAGEASRQGNAEFHAIDPQTAEPFGSTFTNATEAEINRATEAAQDTIDGGWPPSSDAMSAILEAIADQIMALDDVLISLTAAETALPEARIVAERGRTCNQLRLFASVAREGSWAELRIDRADPQRTPLPKPDVRRMLIPIGPVAVFAASNFPLAFSVAGGDTASALAAGNPVIVKAHPAHPGTSQLVGEAIAKAIAACGAPAGLFSLLHGQSHDVGLALVRHPLIQAVGFTGSLTGGRALCDAAAARAQPIPVHAEMGSINPVFLLPSAIADRAQSLAEELVQSVTIGVGQFCTNPGLIVAPSGTATDCLIEAAAEHMNRSAPGVMLAEGIREAYQRGIDRISEFNGVRVAGEPNSATDPHKVTGRIFTTDVENFIATPELREECFGPSTLMVICDDAAGLLKAADSLEGQLTASLMGNDDDLAANAPLIAALQRKVGRLIFNAFPTGVEVCAAMNHGGPYPASNDSRFTSVGTAAIKRFARPICYQGFPQTALPEPLRDDNPRGAWRMIDNEWTQAAIEAPVHA